MGVMTFYDPIHAHGRPSALLLYDKMTCRSVYICLEKPHDKVS